MRWPTLLPAAAMGGGVRRYLLCASFHDGRESALRPGGLARWKPGLKDRRLPEYGQPAVVMGLREPLPGGDDRPGTRAPLDLMLGFIDAQGRFVVRRYDRRRFEPLDLDA
jgi:hypothetical protein